MFLLCSLTRAVSRVVVKYPSPLIKRFVLTLPSLSVSQTHIHIGTTWSELLHTSRHSTTSVC